MINKMRLFHHETNFICATQNITKIFQLIKQSKYNLQACENNYHQQQNVENKQKTSSIIAILEKF